MKTIARSVAVALLTAGAVVVPASAEAIAAPFHAPASATLASRSFDRGDHYSPYGYRHGSDLWRDRDYWRHDNYRYRYCDRHSRWDRDCDRDWRYQSNRWDCLPYWRR
ncbi:hypothetical protein ACFC08_16045 [Streptomyces sp. NPDC056112]|uniref:hypothetical protein n=1 Tax=unclassified Streptomyces TaxID=2593676 RepID=UPI001CD69068|nr:MULTISPECIES: hypothetical protein [unclassified Streptomyces]